MIVVAISLSDGDDVGNVLEKVRAGEDLELKDRIFRSNLKFQISSFNKVFLQKRVF